MIDPQYLQDQEDDEVLSWRMAILVWIGIYGILILCVLGIMAGVGWILEVVG